MSEYVRSNTERSPAKQSGFFYVHVKSSLDDRSEKPSNVIVTAPSKK